MITTLINVLGAILALLMLSAAALGGPLVALHDRLPVSRPQLPRPAAPAEDPVLAR